MDSSDKVQYKKIFNFPFLQIVFLKNPADHQNLFIKAAKKVLGNYLQNNRGVILRFTMNMENEYLIIQKLSRPTYFPNEIARIGPLLLAKR